MDNIIFSTKKEIINNFPIESTHPPDSTHGGIFEISNTLILHWTLTPVWISDIGVMWILIPERPMYIT